MDMGGRRGRRARPCRSTSESLRAITRSHSTETVCYCQGNPDAANQRYLVTAGTYSMQEWLDFIWKRYPERAERFGVSRSTPGKLWPESGVYSADNSKSRRDLGLTYKSLEKTCEETFAHFVQLENELVE